jgi:hypothetical protein
MPRVKVKPHKTKTQIADEVIEARKRGEDANKIGLGKWEKDVQVSRQDLARNIRKIRKNKEVYTSADDKKHFDKKARDLRDHPEDFVQNPHGWGKEQRGWMKPRVTRHYKAGGLAKRGYGIAKRGR